VDDVVPAHAVRREDEAGMSAQCLVCQLVEAYSEPGLPVIVCGHVGAVVVGGERTET
jgi:hypothetical protein